MGVRAVVQGQITRQLGWQTAWQWLNPRFADINAVYNGKLPENASKKTASLFLTYAFDGALQGLSLNAGAYYTGRRPMDDLNQGWLGGNTLYTLGARYRHQMGGNTYTWQLNVDNAANKRYWAAGGNRLSAGLPRTVKLALKVDFHLIKLAVLRAGVIAGLSGMMFRQLLRQQGQRQFLLRDRKSVV